MVFSQVEFLLQDVNRLTEFHIYGAAEFITNKLLTYMRVTSDRSQYHTPQK
jgi:hypothetical protein